jgi:hypothetical protein
MAATKRARVARAMVTGNKEGKGNNKKDGGGNLGGMRQRGQ